jgi:hypothetical protein
MFPIVDGEAAEGLGVREHAMLLPMRCIREIDVPGTADTSIKAGA